MEKIKNRFGPHVTRWIFRAKITSAALSCFFENVVGSFFHSIAWLLAFICIWVFGYDTETLTILFWLGFSGLTIHSAGNFYLPTRRQIEKTLEKRSGLKHQPLQNLSDNPISGGLEFWDLAQSIHHKTLRKLKFVTPDLKLGTRDPYALRAAILLILFSAAFIAPDHWLTKIHHGLSVDLIHSDKAVDTPFAQIKIIPPDYTGIKPFQLNNDSAAVQIPEGSFIESFIPASRFKPTLKFSNGKLSLEHKEGWKLRAPIPPTRKIEITTLGLSRFYAPVKWIKDTPPQLSWAGEITSFASGELSLPLNIVDDYGIKSMTLHGILAVDEKPAFFGKPLQITKETVLVTNGKTLKNNAVFDATGHEWAGKKLSLMVEVQDFAGNTAQTTPIEYVLPQKEFHNPIAAQIATLRMNLLALAIDRDETLTAVEKILFRPDLYNWDMMTTLGLRSVTSRLYFANDKNELEGMMATLWAVASHLDDGEIAQSQTNMKDAVSELQKALQRGADKETIAQLYRNVQQAMMQHLQNIARQMKINQQKPDQMQPAINADALNKFFQDLQNDLVSGDNKTALEKLNALQQLTDKMGANMAQGIPKDIQEMMQDSQSLQELVSAQQKLLDKSREDISQKPNRSLATEQADVSTKTKVIAIKNPKLETLFQAAEQMTQSLLKLKNESAPNAIPFQEKALELLKQSNESLRQKIQQKLKNSMGISVGQSNPQDPLGPHSRMESGTAEVPIGGRHRKTDDIIKILRDRESDTTRPTEEHKYYQRLLKQW